MKRKGRERRKQKRKALRQKVSIEGVGTANGSMISTGGMYIETEVPLPEGSTLSLRFKLADEDPSPVTAQALVMYIHDGVGMGVAFSDLASGDRDRIEKLVNRK
jgi:hypothetical protein